MVRINLQYQGELRCKASHAPSGASVITDAPVDNCGKGESFSPTDLVATALGGCIMTIMGIYAERRGISLEGLNVSVDKVMSEDAPRRIQRLIVNLHMPIAADHPEAAAFERAAHTCPVAKSLAEGLVVEHIWHWQQA